MPVTFSLAQNSRYDPDLKRLIFTDVYMPPAGHTLVLILMANGSYSGVDSGPLAGQYDGEWPFLARSAIPITLATTSVELGGILETWPAPTPPYEVKIEPGHATRQEIVTVTAFNRATATITVTRSAPKTHTPGVILQGQTTVVDGGQTPPLLYIPGEPTAAPARTGSWWAHVVGGGPDAAFSLWESRYWQSAPNLPAGHPVWATLSMLARKVDGSEADLGLYDPLTNQLHVALLGAVPDALLFQPRGTLLGLSQTVELLPLPEVFGDIAPPADRIPTSPPDPRWPPFIWYYPFATWTPRLVGSLPNNNEDLWLPILLSSKSSAGPENAIEGWDDITGLGVEDNPSYMLDENWFSTGTYAVRRQIGYGTFTATHDPNHLIYELTAVGGTQASANVPSAGLGSAREPCVGQNPWWELNGIHPGPLEISSGSVTPTTPVLHTGDIMLVVAQSDGVGAPTAPPEWTLIEAASGPNVHSRQPMTLTTGLWASVLAGASTIQVGLSSLTDFGPVPFTVVIAGGSPLGAPSETLTASSATPHTSEGYIELGVGGVSSPHFGGSNVVITNPGLLASDQYVAAWWKVAEGPPPGEFGVPSAATESGPTISFPDGTRCSARLYGVVAEPSDPLSPPGVGRVDQPAPAWAITGADVIPEDGITLRAGIALAVGSRQTGGGTTLEEYEQDIRESEDGATFMMLPVANPFRPTWSWHEVDPASVGTALCFAFRGFRERPAYPMVDGHYAPNYENRGALPPCAGGNLMASSDYRTGFGISHVVAAANPLGRVLFSRGGMSGNLKYLRAWVWAAPDFTGTADVEATITIGELEMPWFEVPFIAGEDIYPDPPDDQLVLREETYSVRIITRQPFAGYIGIQVWSEEECQPPTVASYGLTAAFRYKHKDLHMPSTQQASIVG